jgi:hypothetical protein
MCVMISVLYICTAAVHTFACNGLCARCLYSCCRRRCHSCRNRTVAFVLKKLTVVNILYMETTYTTMTLQRQILKGSVQRVFYFYFFNERALHVSPFRLIRKLFRTWLQIRGDFHDFQLRPPLSFIAENQYSQYPLVRRVTILCIIYRRELLQYSISPS